MHTLIGVVGVCVCVVVTCIIPKLKYLVDPTGIQLEHHYRMALSNVSSATSALSMRHLLQRSCPECLPRRGFLELQASCAHHGFFFKRG